MLLILAAAAAVRGGAVWLLSEQVTLDRDAYLAIAENLAAGRGYSSVAGGEPTAYRPPLYPVVLAAFVRAAGPAVGVAALNVIAGVLAVWITFRLGRRLGLEGAAALAALLVAFDPLLVQYTAQPMTEVLSACLVAAFAWAVASASSVESRESRAGAERRGNAVGQTAAGTPAREPAASAWRATMAGLLFGMAALCRPTTWLAGALLATWWGARVWRAEGRRSLWRPAVGCLAGAAIVIGPWTVRNWIAFGQPIMTTTHGGYTLLLGNNPVFYREVVEQPWGTTWDGASLERWNASLESDLRREDPLVRGEAARDRWMYARAWRHIRDEPGLCLRACWLRFRRFWNVAPLEQSAGLIEQAWRRVCLAIGWAGGMRSAGAIASAAEWTVATFYTAITAALLAGLVRLRRGEWREWSPLVVIVAAFCLVHLVYWTNTRMRAPVVPLVALLAARGFAGFHIPRRRSSNCS
ncbi:MAG TPA: glycosyltransferase family 39 protein [Planctomycetaceae bacterium]|nr:glycosyltransferase family 39 protein [Planctomycetaceae bacterium]